MKLLELFISDEGEEHFFIEQVGTARNLHPFASNDVDVMYAKAIEILDGDSEFDKQLRIFDTNRRLVKSGELTVSLETLKSWQKQPA